MILNYLGESLDSANEHELVSNSKFGFKVKITYALNNPYSKDTNINLVEECNNCTEVHYLYKSYTKEKRIAFESDIHKTGFVRTVEHIISVDIENALELYKEF